ncbi:phage N-6-adenine-methyltransferase [Enterobacteriaceae bacterium ESL0689]|nr:phage N-6-adenine-methyltransferase [Enterobacteriaceae bacterium ESL0689]
MRYGSVCSGIEAASVAWESLGWEPAWFAETEPFPSAVLAHHWPHVANLGDMTKVAALIADNQIEAPGVLVGGTPCQAFSIAGLRNGLADSRGQLTLSYVELANEIDKKRRERGEPESVIVWENVPGVLNSRDNAFGCFLAGLAGERDELQPPGGRWTNAGCVSGPQRDIAWRVLDAEFFGVAQRRRRVFVIASARTDLNPAKILFECDGVRRDTPPSRETQTETTGTTGKRANSGSHWGNPAAPHPTLNQSNNTGGIGLSNQEIFSQRGSGLVSDTYSDIARTLLAKSNDSVAEDLDTYVLAYGGGNTSGSIDVATACTAHGVRLDFDTETFAVHGTQDPDTSRELAHTLGRNYGQENACISFSYKDDGGDAIENLSPTIRAGNHNTSHANSGQPPAIALAGNTIGRSPCNGGNGTGYNQEICYTLTKTDIHGVVANARVRRLTPVECERLQGFPDNHTQIPWRGQDAVDCPDGPRYKAIGNSMAVPVMRWLGQRIAAVLPVNSTAEAIQARPCFGGSNTPTPLRNLWQTPLEIFAALNAEFIFQLDAAAAVDNALCHKFITAEQNTLITPWSDYLETGYVWLNPPYSNIAPFIRKAAEENKNHQIGTVALLPADTSVGWFREAIQTASEVRFITGGRLSFINPETGKPVNGNNKGSLLVIWHPYPRTHCRFTTVERDELMNFGAKILSGSVAV